MSIVIKNNASNFLADGINDSQTTIDLQSAASFPALGAGEYFYGTIESVSGQIEIVKVTNIAGNTLTVVRAQEGTSAASFVEGSRFELRVTVGSVEDYVKENAELADYTPDGSSAVVRSIESKLQDAVSVKDFGAVGDGVADDTAAIQAALDSGFDNQHAVYLPAGTYNHTGLTIKAQQGSPFYSSRRVKFYGDGIGVSILQHTGTGVALDIVGHLGGNTNTYGAVIHQMSVRKNSNTTHGIRLPGGTGYILDQLFLEANNACILIPEDIWLSKFTNLTLWPAEYGIKMNKSGTSNYFDQCFAESTSITAYDIRGIYSTIGALAADNCTGSNVYNFEFFQGSIASLGCEGADVSTILRFRSASVDVGQIEIFSANITDTKGRPIFCQSANVSIRSLNISSPSGGGSVAQTLYTHIDSRLQIDRIDSVWTFTVPSGDSAYNSDVIILGKTKAPPVALRFGKRAYLGLDNKVQGVSLDDAGEARANAIFLDAAGSPRFGSDGTDYRFAAGATVGNWFIERDPATTLTAGYVVTAAPNFDFNGLESKRIPLHYSGTTGSRPVSPYTGMIYFDTTLGKPVWYDGSGWVDATGTTA